MHSIVFFQVQTMSKLLFYPKIKLSHFNYLCFVFAPNEIVKHTNTVTKTYHKCYHMEWGHRNRFLIIQQFPGINRRKSRSVAVHLDNKKITFNY